MSKFINPYTDYGFKLIFGSEINKELIISFLNGVLQNEVIVDITFRNVEMQKSPQKYFSDRVLYYASFAIQQQTLLMKEKMENTPEKIQKQWRYEIQKVYVVCILNYIMEPDYPDKFRWDIVGMDHELKVPFSETLNEVYLEMPKFVLPLSECDTIYKKWLYVLNNIDIMERLPEELNNQIFRKLKSIVEVERMTPDEHLEYELSLSVERDLYACMATQFEQGEAKGFTEGEAKGREEGRLAEKRENARRLKEMGVDSNIIAESLGLSSAEVENL